MVGAVRVSGAPPILVTGAHRSGTTWVGRMLALAPGVGYIHEPFNPRTPAGLSSAPFDRYFTVVTTENEGRYLPGLERTVAFRYDLGAQLRWEHRPVELARGARDFARLLPPRLRRARPL